MHEYLKKLLPLKRHVFVAGGLSGGIYSGGKVGAPILVLQHGLTGDHRGLIPLAYELRHDYQLFLTELPGHGESPLPDTHVTLADLAEWFAAALAHIGPQPIVLAHSFGCSVALRALAVNPASMAHSVLMNPVPKMAGHVQFYQWVGNRLPYAVTRRVDAVTLFRRIKMHMMFERKEKAEALAELFLPAIGAFDERHATFYLRLGEQVQRDDVYHEPAMQAAWPKVSAVVGPRDTLLSPSATRLLGALLSPQRIIAVPQTGHLSPIEAPEETAHAVHTLLNE